MIDNKVYSPVQAALGAFLGGPVASVFFLLKNFDVTNNQEAIKKTKVIGAIIIVLFLLILPFLPENFPNLLLPILTVVGTRIFIEKYQFKKQDIVENEQLEFQSNWSVLFVGLGSLAVSMAALFGLTLALNSAGVLGPF